MSICVHFHVMILMVMVHMCVCWSIILYFVFHVNIKCVSGWESLAFLDDVYPVLTWWDCIETVMFCSFKPPPVVCGRAYAPLMSLHMSHTAYLNICTLVKCKNDDTFRSMQSNITDTFKRCKYSKILHVQYTLSAWGFGIVTNSSL